MSEVATDWLRLADAAKLAGVPRSTFDDRVRAGEIPFVPTPLGRLFDREGVEAWAAARNEEVASRGRAA